MVEEFEEKVMLVVKHLVQDEQHIVDLYRDVFENNPTSIIEGLELAQGRAKNELTKTTDSFIVKSLNEEIKTKYSSNNEDLYKPFGSIQRISEANEDRLGIDFWFDTNIINIEELKRAIKFIGYAPHAKMYYDSQTGIYYVAEKDIKDRYIAKKIFKKKVDAKHKQYYIDKKPFGSSKMDNGYKMYVKKGTTFILDAIRDNNQYSTVSYSVDPFLSEPKSSFKDEVLSIISNELLPVKPEFVYDNRIIDDYKQHFNLDEFLDFLVASRFGDPKRAYMWFRAPSDFGKSFLFEGVIGGLGISSTITESELKASQTGSASGWTAETFKNSWMLFVDEFSSNVKEFKNITHKLSFSPKFKGTVTVDMYAKVFASAENVFSLNMDGYVEDQFKNRFIFWREKNGTLKNRAIFREGQLKYKEVVQTYVYEYLKRESDKLISLGKYEAEKLSTDKLEELRAKHTVANQKNIEDLISERRDDLIRTVIEVHKSDNEKFIKKYEDILEYTFVYKDGIYINNKGMMTDYFRRKHFSPMELKSVGKKSDAVMLGLADSIERQYFTIDKKSQGGSFWIDISEKSSFDDGFNDENDEVDNSSKSDMSNEEMYKKLGIE